MLGEGFGERDIRLAVAKRVRGLPPFVIAHSASRERKIDFSLIEGRWRARVLVVWGFYRVRLPADQREQAGVKRLAVA